MRKLIARIVLGKFLARYTPNIDGAWFYVTGCASPFPA